MPKYSVLPLLTLYTALSVSVKRTGAGALHVTTLRALPPNRKQYKFIFIHHNGKTAQHNSTVKYVKKGRKKTP